MGKDLKTLMILKLQQLIQIYLHVEIYKKFV